MSRIYYDSAAVNISVFIEQRNLSFQNDILLKTRRLGVLWWEKLKKTWAIADLFVMIIAWTSKKASWMVINFCQKQAIVLIWNIKF